MSDQTHAPRPQTRPVGMTQFFDELSASLAQNFKRLASQPLAFELQRSCLSCARFVEDREICVLYNKRPPARVIAYSCTDYSDTIAARQEFGASVRAEIDDDIPF